MAGDFYKKPGVHVNHLNYAVKEITGKNTTEMITSRIANEAKAILKYSDSSISEIAYSPGFEFLSNFNIFFKKHLRETSRAMRNKL